MVVSALVDLADGSCRDCRQLVSLRAHLADGPCRDGHHHLVVPLPGACACGLQAG